MNICDDSDDCHHGDDGDDDDDDCHHDDDGNCDYGDEYICKEAPLHSSPPDIVRQMVAYHW